MTPDPVRPGQRSVWDFPRPPAIEPEPRRLEIVHRGQVIAATSASFRTLETSHPPTYYFPPGSVTPGVLQRAAQSSFCEWKGHAVYFDVVAGGEVLPGVAWSYPAPTAAFEALRDHLAFYAAPFDACTVGGKRVTPQPGGFYGGWITSDLAGPFKGVPGSRFW
ncbi:DUF427 domain-containing protein [Glacieibacterium frigidum]|uniref:DUF427 domain-containing protein n=1 Tax=Glacieibacterium frigidum TaxID=2593303 RepID=A0A552UJ75_9SPHN|nr:DUF427 domain-containing protein [Glacieibacterium frigidum]TRW18296.1 DUF427 domain-containing protein [Glacieibacterium frigidum]